MNDLEIRQFEESLVNLINEASLPLEIKRLIVADIYRKLEVTTNQSIQSLLKQEESDNGNN